MTTVVVVGGKVIELSDIVKGFAKYEPIDGDSGICIYCDEGKRSKTYPAMRTEHDPNCIWLMARMLYPPDK